MLRHAGAAKSTSWRMSFFRVRRSRRCIIHDPVLLGWINRKYPRAAIERGTRANQECSLHKNSVTQSENVDNGDSFVRTRKRRIPFCGRPLVDRFSRVFRRDGYDIHNHRDKSVLRVAVVTLSRSRGKRKVRLYLFGASRKKRSVSRIAVSQTTALR